MEQRSARERFSPPAVGGISLLVVFAVLCLTVFALLALTTVQADVRLADASAQAVEDYYAADCRAQEILARVRNGETPENVEMERVDGVTSVRYACPISEASGGGPCQLGRELYHFALAGCGHPGVGIGRVVKPLGRIINR